MNAPTATPVAPLATAGLFPGLGEELLALLRGLSADDWLRPTVCPGWQVRDVAAHLLDTALRRLSFGRDAFPPPPPGEPIASYRDLVGLIDRLNAEWVTALGRLSPGVLTELLADAEPRLAAHLAALDP